jgi:nitrite reductase/ring-hydroxylating ferredoxin subunit
MGGLMTFDSVTPIRIAVCRLDDLHQGEIRGVNVCGRDIAIYRLKSGVFATDDCCTHGRVRLSRGQIIDGKVQCPLHVAWFDIATGKGLGPPISKDLRTYPISVTNGTVEVTII